MRIRFVTGSTNNGHMGWRAEYNTGGCGGYQRGTNGTIDGESYCSLITTVIWTKTYEYVYYVLFLTVRNVKYYRAKKPLEESKTGTIFYNHE